MRGTSEIEIHRGDGTRRVVSGNGGLGARCLFFGDDTVTLCPKSSELTTQVGESSQRVAISPQDELCIVVQKGRLFQLEYPEIDVFLDRGRYLLVRIPPERRDLIAQQHEPCFSITQAIEGKVLFEHLPRPFAREPVSSQLTSKLDRLQIDLFRDSLNALSSISSRFSTSSGYDDAIADCERRLQAFGYDVTKREILVPGYGNSRNLTARWRGVTDSPQILVTAHLDSINGLDGPSAPAPGADDNATGCAGIITLAAALAEIGAAQKVLFVLFGGEEQGLHGSLQFVKSQSDYDPSAVTAVINMDMIGSINPPEVGNSDPLSVLLEGGEISRGVIDGLAAAAHRHTSLQVSRSFIPERSDHVPFIDAGIPAVLTIEGQDATNRFIHSAQDIPDYIDPELAMQILRMNMGYILETVNSVSQS